MLFWALKIDFKCCEISESFAAGGVSEIQTFPPGEFEPKLSRWESLGIAKFHPAEKVCVLCRPYQHFRQATKKTMFFFLSKSPVFCFVWRNSSALSCFKKTCNSTSPKKQWFQKKREPESNTHTKTSFQKRTFEISVIHPDFSGSLGTQWTDLSFILCVQTQPECEVCFSKDFWCMTGKRSHCETNIRRLLSMTSLTCNVVSQKNCNSTPPKKTWLRKKMRAKSNTKVFWKKWTFEKKALHPRTFLAHWEHERTFLLFCARKHSQCMGGCLSMLVSTL